ncbi:hypothetical protein Fleli_3371 [Bernardetia litoralis DSM 6794]|uniref:Uncharacterized protein n=1 Tax=Bernardetia litoralis (strain ATCC 23117 / DSM 6794 / NBRC 15988 / NCIMB 1366 / Fx l1 / Sio-4) TaxID=880071 RepID=I4AP10_BERLS|nr:hypothetical protein [Bernardetia litoralis]AFM05695.1 hypothetical protein Fleli_3371 [Bernardetia litoralis DSM 6794]
MNHAKLLYGTYVHEVAHNLGAEHEDNTSAMDNVHIIPPPPINTGGQSAEKKYTYPSFDKKLIRILLEKRDLRNKDPNKKTIDSGIYTEKKKNP